VAQRRLTPHPLLTADFHPVSGAQLCFTSTFVLLLHISGVSEIGTPTRRTLQARRCYSSAAISSHLFYAAFRSVHDKLRSWCIRQHQGVGFAYLNNHFCVSRSGCFIRRHLSSLALVLSLQLALAFRLRSLR
jgi:hypothetical protein